MKERTFLGKHHSDSYFPRKQVNCLLIISICKSLHKHIQSLLHVYLDDALFISSRGKSRSWCIDLYGRDAARRIERSKGTMSANKEDRQYRRTQKIEQQTGMVTGNSSNVSDRAAGFHRDLKERTGIKMPLYFGLKTIQPQFSFYPGEIPSSQFPPPECVHCATCTHVLLVP